MLRPPTAKDACIFTSAGRVSMRFAVASVGLMHNDND